VHSTPQAIDVIDAALRPTALVLYTCRMLLSNEHGDESLSMSTASHSRSLECHSVKHDIVLCTAGVCERCSGFALQKVERGPYLRTDDEQRDAERVRNNEQKVGRVLKTLPSTSWHFPEQTRQTASNATDFQRNIGLIHSFTIPNSLAPRGIRKYNPNNSGMTHRRCSGSRDC